MNSTLRPDLLCSSVEAFVCDAGTLRAHYSDCSANHFSRRHLSLEALRPPWLSDPLAANRFPPLVSFTNSSDPTCFKEGFVAYLNFPHAQADGYSQLCQGTADDDCMEFRLAALNSAKMPAAACCAALNAYSRIDSNRAYGQL